MKYGRSRERARQDEGSLLFLGEDLYTSACICLGAAIFTLECNASAQKDCLIQVCVCVCETRWPLAAGFQPRLSAHSLCDRRLTAVYFFLNAIVFCFFFSLFDVQI